MKLLAAINISHVGSNKYNISKDSYIGYVLPDRTNLDEGAHIHVERSYLQLACDVEGTVV